MSKLDSRLDPMVQAVSAVSQVAQGLEGRGAGETVVSSLKSLAGGGIPLPRVRYGFCSAVNPELPWHVLRVHIREGLCELYEATVDLALGVVAEEPDELLGSSCELHLERGGAVRSLRGLARLVEDLGTLACKRLVRVHLVPALWQLSQRVDSYIFQERTVPQILQEVLKEGLSPSQRSVRLELQREYPVREFCVQYSESDLDFVLRLMGEEGISFYFDHRGKAEELVLVDDPSSYKPCETMDGGAVWISNSAGDLAERETVRGLEWRTALRPTGVTVWDFDWTRPRTKLTKKLGSTEWGGREEYLYPAEFTIGGYDRGSLKYTEDDSSTRARLLREGQQVGARQGKGSSNVTGFRAGCTFSLRGHFRADLEQQYLITRIEHFGEEAGDRPLPSPEQAQGAQYINHFDCIPLAVPFRPERPWRRRMPGLQTATVVGPAGEEIYTDEHGRIKVQFHWDRAGRSDERASCWVRVAQAWAGTGFGALFIPRVGMEVVVDFLEGNPDRPLVIGCVYNGLNLSPALLPEERTRSTLRTQSSPGGEGFNELRFEDANGAEQIFLHAQRDLSQVVNHDHCVQVGNDQTLAIHGDRSLTVSGSETCSVGGTRDRKVSGRESVTLESGRRTTITGAEELAVSQKYHLTQGPTTLTFEGGHVELSAGSYHYCVEARQAAGSVPGSLIAAESSVVAPTKAGRRGLPGYLLRKIA